MFLEVRNNKTYHDDDMYDMICRELIRIESIVHVYIDMGTEKAICIEYKDRRGENREIYESFASTRACTIRFNELSKILTKERNK